MSDPASEPSSDGDFPPVREIKGDISAAAHAKDHDQGVFVDAFRQKSMAGERDYVHLRGLSDHYRHKSLWSIFIALIMAFMIVFQSVLLSLVGAGIWSFEKYTWLLPALLVQNLAQIVGLAVFVVKALFREMDSK